MTCASLCSSEKVKVSRVDRSLSSREYGNLSGSKKGHSLDSLNPSKGKYNNLDKRESGITEKSYEIF